MKGNFKILLNKNIVFLLFIVILPGISCYSRAFTFHSSDKFLQLYAVLSSNQTNATKTPDTNNTENSKETNITKSSNSTPPVAPNSNNTTPSANNTNNTTLEPPKTNNTNNTIPELPKTNNTNNTTPESAKTNATKNDLSASTGAKTNTENAEDLKKTPPVDNSKFQESMDQNNKKLTDLEKAVKEQAKFIDDVKVLVKDVGSLSQQMNKTGKENEKIMSSLDDLKDFYKELDYKITTNSIETDNKLNLINSKLVEQLRNQLTAQLFNLEKDISSLEEEVKKLNLKIKEIKSQLPSADSVCSLFNSCVSCTSNPSCGWCSLSQECVEGDVTGPKDGACTFYDYKVCSGPRECDSYKTCDSCIKDISCGWCSNPGNPVCMSKEDADKNNCSEDRFVHLWRSLNVCPSVNIANFKAVTLQALKENEQEQKSANPLELNPQRKKYLTEQLKVYLDEKNKKEVLLIKYLKVSNETQQQIKNLESDNLQFNLIDQMHNNQKNKFYDISSSLFGLLKDYLVSFTKESVEATFNQTNKPVSNVTKSEENNNTNITLPANQTQVEPPKTNATSNQTMPVQLMANGTTNQTNMEKSTVNENVPGNKNQTEQAKANTNATTNQTQHDQAKANTNATTNQTQHDQAKANATAMPKQTKQEAPQTNSTTNQTQPAATPQTNAKTAKSEPQPSTPQTNATAEMTQTKPEASQTNSTTNQTKHEAPVTSNTNSTANTTTQTRNNTNSTASDDPNNTKGTNKLKNPSQAPESDEVVKNDKKQLLQMVAEFGVDKDTFMNSFIEKKRKEQSNLRTQSKIIIL